LCLFLVTQAVASDFVTPICGDPSGCVHFTPAVPTSNQKVSVEIRVSSGVPADATPCPPSLTTKVIGTAISINGTYSACGIIGLEPPPPYFVTAIIEPLAAGHYTLEFTIAADPKYGSNGWVLGPNGPVQAGVIINASLDVVAAVPSTPNYQGLWWAAPSGSESGWGLNVAHQGEIIFATWFTYKADGSPWWLAMIAPEKGANSYSGVLYETRGPRFNSVPFDSDRVVVIPVGDATLNFADPNNGTFDYEVNGIAQTRPITRQIFGPAPNCTFGVESDLAVASNFQDLWWASPAGSESGWGINLTQQGDIIFATWFTYDVDGVPLWLSATATSVGSRIYSGLLYRTSGPAFNAMPFDREAVRAVSVGTATFSFVDGNQAYFSYSVDGVAQVKQITRQVFRAPGTVCQ
jgi:hypothetical protein